MSHILENIAKSRKSLTGISFVLPERGEGLFPEKRFANLSKIVEETAKTIGAVGIIPCKKAAPKDVWWTELIKRDSVKIIAKIDDSYLLATDSPYGKNRSIIALATNAPVSSAWLKTAMQKQDIPFYKSSDSTAIAGGLVLHLVELSHSFKDDSDKICKLDTEINGVRLKFAALLGGYDLEDADSKNIMSFRGLTSESIKQE